MILIASADKDFSSTLAEQVTRELKLACKTVEDIEKEKSFLQQAQFVVCDSEIKNVTIPCLQVNAHVPMRLRDILSRIAQQLQKPQNPARNVGKDYAFMPQQKQMQHTASGKIADLTDKEAQLLMLMLDAGNKGMSREELLRQVWGFEADLNTHTLETHIYRLRGKFKDMSGSDAIIEATDGGYRLTV